MNKYLGTYKCRLLLSWFAPEGLIVENLIAILKYKHATSTYEAKMLKKQDLSSI